MTIKVVIPAFDEARWLPCTLEHLDAARRACPVAVDVVVVDNASRDDTAAVARRSGALVVREDVHNIARVRNAGARAARGDVLVFVDADTIVPTEFLRRVAEEMAGPDCVGGAADAEYAPSSSVVGLYLAYWRLLGRALGMAQGPGQFCRRDIFAELGGYDDRQYMGEDVDFFWRLARLARRTGRRVAFLRDVRVVPSPRRFDRWPLWRTLVWTNPVVIAILRRRQGAWAAWYSEPVR